MKQKFIGTVVWFDKGPNYGFIEGPGGEEGKDVFVHWSDIQMEGFKILKKGQKVEYSIGANNQGKPKAIEVKVVEETSTKE